MMGGTSPFIGREAEFARLEALLQRARSGSSAFAFVRGEPGVGKSRLLQEAGTLARDLGFTVLAGGARELERGRPFGAIADALGLRSGSRDPERARLGRMLLGGPADIADPGSRGDPGDPGDPGEPGDPGAGRGDGAPPADLRFRLIEELTDVVERETASGPALLALDDLQWADGSTVMALDHIGRTLAASPLAVILANRPIPEALDIDRLAAGLGRGRAVTIALGPLAPASVDRLVTDAVGGEPDARLRAQVDGAGGNPFYVHELVDALVEEGAIDVHDGRAELVGASLPPTLRITVLRRLGFLPEPTISLLRMASVAGSSFALSDLVAITKRPVAEILGALDPALRAGVLSEAEAGRRLRFRHDLVHEAVYTDIPGPVRAALHLEAARALGAAGADAGRVATHFVRGAERGDLDAVVWMRRAARQILPGNPAAAAELLEQAADLLEPGAPERDEVLVERVHALLWASRISDAGGLAREMIARPHDPRTAGALHNGIARALVWQGRPADSLAHLEEGLREPRLPQEDQLFLMAELALRRLHCRDLSGAEDAAREVLARAGPDLSLEACNAYLAMGWVEHHRGRLDDGLALVTRGVAIGDAPGGDRARLIVPRMYLSNCLIQADRIAEAEDVNRAMLREIEALSLIRVRPIVQGWAAAAAYLAGDWDSAAVEAETSLSSADEVGMRAFILWPYSVLALMAVHRGDLRAAGRLLDAGEAEIAPHNMSRFGLPWLLWARSLFEEASGDAAGALSLLAGTWDLLVALDCLGETQDLAPDLARLAAAAGDGTRAAEVAAGAERLARLAGTAGTRAAALRCRGLAEHEPDLLVRAAAAMRATPRTPELACACADAGVALAEAGRTREAASLLSEAATIFERTGALRDLDRVEAALRATGVRRGVRGSRRRPTTGWESLTATELEVSRLAADGLTNPEIGARLYISKRTVGTHLAHIFAKLDIISRVQLAAEVAARRTGAPADGTGPRPAETATSPLV